MTIRDASILRGLVCAALLVPLTGCPTVDNSNANGNTNSGTSNTGSDNNGSFLTASPISFTDGKASLSSALARNELDLYKLGTLATGDHVTVDVQATSGNLDPVAAVFDADQNAIAFNDDRNADGSDLNPLIDTTIFGTAGDYYLGITPFPGDGSTGNYKVTVTVTPGAVPAPHEQLVYLDYVGGTNIDVPNVGNFDLQPFDASMVGLSSAQTAGLKSGVLAYVQARYSGLDIIFTSSDGGAAPAAAHSTVYFGDFNQNAFAISQQIDGGNADASDKTIVFAESFAGAFSTRPTLNQMITAMGNTTAHEVGHLLGLIHTKACTDLMDTTCGNDSILVPQSFTRAPIDDSVFPVGFQDALAILGWELGTK